MMIEEWLGQHPAIKGLLGAVALILVAYAIYSLVLEVFGWK